MIMYAFLKTIAFSAMLSCSLFIAFLHAADENKNQQDAPVPTKQSESIIIQQADVKFHPAPGLPDGANISVLRGDISKAEPYTLRLELPDCYVIPPHWHTNAEEVTVISGTFNVGLGDKIDTTKSTALTAGGFQIVPEKANHYVWSKGTTVVQLDGMGPRDTHFVDPKELIPLFKSNKTCP